MLSFSGDLPDAIPSPELSRFVNIRCGLFYPILCLFFCPCMSCMFVRLLDWVRPVL